MKKYKIIIIFINLIIILVLFNNSVIEKERILKNGKLILLELAPKDPRSLIQGDYMDLRYKISTGIKTDNISKRGYCVLKIDSLGVADRVRLQNNIIPKNSNESLIEYTSNSFNINIGAESYFFEEGQQKKYEKAKYGAVKIDEKGNSILIGLYDINRKKIE